MNVDYQKKELLISLQEYLGRFILGLKEVVLLMQQGEEQKALEGIIDAVEGLGWITEAMSLTHDLHTAVFDIGKINGFLSKINEGLEENDTVLIADILEYEIIPIIEEWDKVINQ